jgi:hypothetical protein
MELVKSILEGLVPEHVRTAWAREKQDAIHSKRVFSAESYEETVNRLKGEIAAFDEPIAKARSERLRILDALV